MDIWYLCVYTDVTYIHVYIHICMYKGSLLGIQDVVSLSQKSLVWLGLRV